MMFRQRGLRNSTIADMSAVFDYPHTVVAEDIDKLGHAGNYHYAKWMQHTALAHSTAKAETGWAFINYAGQRPVRIPAEVADCFVIVTGRDTA